MQQLLMCGEVAELAGTELLSQAFFSHFYFLPFSSVWTGATPWIHSRRDCKKLCYYPYLRPPHCASHTFCPALHTFALRLKLHTSIPWPTTPTPSGSPSPFHSNPQGSSLPNVPVSISPCKLFFSNVFFFSNFPPPHNPLLQTLPHNTKTRHYTNENV